jgi:putative ABC transport system permease protein
MTGLYSINYLILGSSNRYLQKVVENETGNNVPVASNTIYKSFSSFTGINNSDINAVLLTFLIISFIVLFLGIFFKTHLGIALRATGDNEEMVRSSAINADFTRIIGISLGNALVGLSGALLCQKQNFADLNYGAGMLIMGLAAVIIGQIIIHKHGITFGIILAVIGSIIYHMIISLAYQIEMPSYMVKLISSSIVFIAMIYPLVKNKTLYKKHLNSIKSKEV